MTAEDHPDMRASDGDRERTIDVLRDAAGDGRLTFEELAERVEAASEATTVGALEQLKGDLPSCAVAPATAGEVAPPGQQRSTIFGDVRRSGPWLVPVRSSWTSCFGDIVLDLRESRAGAAQVTIEARTIFGEVELLVPEGMLVEIRCSTVLGNIVQDAGDLASPGAPLVILTGRTVFGNVRVRSRRMRERIAERFLGRGDII